MSLDVSLIRQSFSAAVPHAPQIVDRFYEILWQDFPEVKGLFAKTNMPQQKTALASSLVFIVGHLDKPEKLSRYLQSMGQRHVHYGVEAKHYNMVGQSLLKTLAEAFGAEWTAKLAAEWTSAVQTIATTMQSRPLETASESSEALSVRLQLSPEIKDSIRKTVRLAVRQAFDAEVELATKEALHELAQQLEEAQKSDSSLRNLANERLKLA